MKACLAIIRRSLYFDDADYHATIAKAVAAITRSEGKVEVVDRGTETVIFSR